MRVILILLWSVLFTSTASAGLILNGNKLMGATDINVGGTLYDVYFAEGSCSALFNGCDEESDFTFDSANALLASQALFDQVLTDGPQGLFDSNPGLTFGCVKHANVCSIYTPYLPFRPITGPIVYSRGALNTAPNVYLPVQRVFINDLSRDHYNSSQVSGSTWAIWSPTPVPEPNTITMILLALMFLYFRHRKVNWHNTNN